MFVKKAAFVFCALTQALSYLHAGYPGNSGGDDFNGTSPNPSYSLTEDQNLSIELDGNGSLPSYELWGKLSGTGPYVEGTTTSAGSLNSITGSKALGFQITFDPKDNFEGIATFKLQSYDEGTGLDTNHSFRIEMISANDAPRLKFRDSSDASEKFNTSASYIVAENSQLVAHVYGDELDAGDSVALSLPPTVGDNDRFDLVLIDAATNKNQIRFKSSSGADFESPLDVGSDNTYDITVLGTDNSAETVQQTVSITIGNADEKPDIQPEGSQDFNMTEDKIDDDPGSFYLASQSGSEYFKLTATDPDIADSFVKWKLATAPSKGKVYYNSSSGAYPMGTANELTTSSSVSSSVIYIDYHPDGNATNADFFIIRAADQNNAGLYADFRINVDIFPVDDDAPEWQPSGEPGGVHDYSISEANSSQTIATLVAIDADSPPAPTYSIIGGADQSLFDISNAGLLTFSSPINYEGKSDSNGDDVFEVTVRTTDGTYDVDLPVTVTLVDTNEAPVIQPLAAFISPISFAEGTTWTLPSNFLSGADVDFGANGSTGGSDSLDDDNYTLTWSTSTPPSNGGVITWTHTSGTAPDFTYTPVHDSVTQFPESNQTGSETFTIKVEDANGLYAEQTFIANVSPVADAPLIWKFQRDADISDVSTYTADQRLTFSYPENSSAATPIQVFVREYDGEPVTFSLLSDGTTDVDHFTLEDQNSTSSPYLALLKFDNSFVPDFESPADSGNDNNYSIKVRVDDDGSLDYQLVDIIITDQPEKPIIIIPSEADHDSLDDTLTDFNVTIDENSVFVTNLNYSDPDLADANASVEWLMTGGADKNKFDLNVTTGALSFKSVSVPNFENPLDAGFDRNYTVSFRVKEVVTGMQSDEKTIHVKIRDINDFPILTPVPLAIFEPDKTNAQMNLNQYVQDDDNNSGIPDTLTWSPLLSPDISSFALESNGTLKFNQATDFESGQISFILAVRVDDGRGGSADANFTIQVNAKDEPPEFFEGNGSSNTITKVSFVIDEDNSYTGNLSDYARDPETNSSSNLTFGHDFVDFNGTNDSNGSLVLDILSGEFTFTPKANYSGLVYVNFSATDSINTPSILESSFKVLPVPDAPEVREAGNPAVLTSLLPKHTPEGNSTFSIEFNATDPNDTPPSTNFTWSLQGPDATKFKIEPYVASDVTLSFLQVPDFESPHDSDGDNRYDLNVSVTDDSGSVFTFPVQVTIGDGPEPPYFDYGDNNQSVTHKVVADFPENGTGTVFDAHAFDLDGSAIVYGLTLLGPIHDGQGPDNALFYVNPSSGKVTFQSPPDFETPLDQNATNIYVLELNATDDPANSNKIRHFVTVRVTNVIEPPVFLPTPTSLTGANRAIDWGETTTTMIEANQTDVEDENETIILEKSGGLDESLFSINVATGMLSFVTPADYENPGSADGDNVYDVQIRIQGTSITQDLTITVKEENDYPIITSTGLTQITVNENQTFVLDLDVTDQDSGPEYLDILYTKHSSSARFVAHTGVESSVDAFYPTVSSGMVDNNLGAASFSVAGDLDQDGDVDVICLEKDQHNIHFLKNDGTGNFSRQTVNAFDDVISGEPNHAIITDLDQDGDLDLVVAFASPAEIGWFENNKTGNGEFASKVTLAPSYSNLGLSDYVASGDLDGDSFLDLVVAYRGENSVDWYKNDGASDPSFTWAGHVMTFAEGLVDPLSLELVDIDNSGSLDVIISAKENIYLAVNDGRETIFTTSSLTSFTGWGVVAKAVDVTQDGLMDVVYATTNLSAPEPRVIVQNATGFNAPLALPAHSTSPLFSPTDIAILPATSNTRLTLVVSDSSIDYLSLFEVSLSLDGNFEDPILIDTGSDPGGIANIVLADLNRQPDYLTYSFDGGEDEINFDATRFKDEGKLYFNFSPDYEDPQDAGQINRYDVNVKVSDGQGGETVQSVAVSVNEINDPPEITDFNRSYMASHDHNESRLYTLFEVNATNDEYTTQTLTYSLAGGADESNFTIDSVTGKLTFAQPPDFETPSDSNKDNAYNVIVRVTDNGQPSAYDEQNITINVVDGDEPPKFDSTFPAPLPVDEDGILSGIPLSANDLENGGSITSFGIETNGTDGNATVMYNALSPGTATFSYVPDGNFTGTDTVWVNVTNSVGLTVTLPITITVNSFNDPPEILTPLDLNHSENLQFVTDLSAVDDSGLPVLWSWATLDPISQYDPDKDFILTSSGNLSFRLLKGPDYENPDPDQNNTYVLPLRVTDSDGNYTDRNLTINVVNVNDNPPLSPHLAKNATSNFTMVENNTTIIDLNASDADNLTVSNFNVITYLMTGGDDSTRFSVTTSGQLSLLPAPDYENPASADGDNTYEAELTLSDGGHSKVYPIVVIVTNADETAPSITSDVGGDITHSENIKEVTQVQATDDESDVFTFSIDGGTDQSLFDINETTGVLSFKTPPDYEKPLGSYASYPDSKGNTVFTNTYEVYVRVADSYSFAQQELQIKVTDVDEIPTVSPANFSILEDEPGGIPGITFTVSDPEGKTYAEAYVHTLPEHGSTSWSAFPLGSPSDVKFDYTPAADFHGTDYLVLTVTDGVKQGQVIIPIEINATDDPPTANPDEFIYDDPTGASMVIDVLANDSSLPDSNTSDSLNIPEGTWTKPKYGYVGGSPAGSVAPYSYTPPEDFIGIDTVQYTVHDREDGEESNGTVTIIVKRATGLPSWRFLKNFGYYNLSANNWIYHTNLGWLYLQNSNDLETVTWVWHEDIGWFWTGDRYAPNVYLNDLSGWFAFTVEEAVGETAKKYMTWPIYDQTKKKWMTADELKIARVNTVLSKLTALEDIISFVQDSNLFTSEEKVVIKTELTFTGTSPTMVAKGFTLRN